MPAAIRNESPGPVLNPPSVAELRYAFIMEPFVVPANVPDTVYLVVDCHGPGGCVWREAGINGTDSEAVIAV